MKRCTKLKRDNHQSLMPPVFKQDGIVLNVYFFMTLIYFKLAFYARQQTGMVQKWLS